MELKKVNPETLQVGDKLRRIYGDETEVEIIRTTTSHLIVKDGILELHIEKDMVEDFFYLVQHEQEEEDIAVISP